MSWRWRDLVVLTFPVLLPGAAMIANVSDGLVSEYRGCWVTRARSVQINEGHTLQIGGSIGDRVRMVA